MKLSIQHFWTERNEKKVRNDLDRNVVKNVKEDPQLWRDILAYWILGLCTEFGYVVIICAAHDILHRFECSNVKKIINNLKTITVFAHCF